VLIDITGIQYGNDSCITLGESYLLNNGTLFAWTIEGK